MEGSVERQPHAQQGVWLFQANPVYYDIRAAVSSLEHMNWTTVQHAKEIRAGDAVYLWESGSQGGLLARGSVISDPRPMPDEDGQRFIRDQSKFEGEQTRVRLRIDDVLSSPIGRETLSDHAILKDLQVLRFANATNFRVTPEEREALGVRDGSEPPTKPTCAKTALPCSATATTSRAIAATPSSRR